MSFHSWKRTVNRLLFVLLHVHSQPVLSLGICNLGKRVLIYDLFVFTRHLKARGRFFCLLPSFSHVTSPTPHISFALHFEHALSPDLAFPPEGLR
jgi:hypothetical protein